MMNDFKEIISRWPKTSVNTLAADLEQKRETVRKWLQRGHVPDENWLDMIGHAKRRKINLKDRDFLVAAKNRVGKK